MRAEQPLAPGLARWLFRPMAAWAISGPNVRNRLVEHAGPVVRTPLQPVEESGLAGLASFEVVPGDLLAMQRVVGSSPIIHFEKPP
jgi:hypothetical protein